MKKCYFVLLVAMGLVYGSVQAATNYDSLPRYNVTDFCQSIADAAGGSYLIRNSCLHEEQGAYNRLKLQWPSIYHSVKSLCDDIGHAAGGSYMILESCIDEELNAQEQSTQFTY